MFPCGNIPVSFTLELFILTWHGGTDEQQGRPPDRHPHSTQKSEPLSEKGEPLTCSPCEQSGGSSGFSPPRPAFSLQREYLSVVTRGDRWEVAGLDFRG